MKILKDGKEVKSAKVIHDEDGRPSFVEVDGVQYIAEAFEFQDTPAVKKTATAPKTRKK